MPICKPHILLFALLFLAGTSFGQTPLVWPGDANNNGICNHVDVLYVGMGYGYTGTARAQIDSMWQGFPVSSLWTDSLPDGTNFAYADCDGSGDISQADLAPIIGNYSLTHGFVVTDSFVPGSPVNPGLSLIFPTDTLTSGSTVIVPLSIGTVMTPLDSIYGIAFSISYDTSLIASVSMDFSSSMFNGGSNPLTFFRDLRNQQRSVGAIVRGDHVNSTGYGIGGNVIIVMEDNLKSNISAYSLNMHFSETRAVTRYGDFVPLYWNTSSAVVISGTEQEKMAKGTAVYPNPSADDFTTDFSGSVPDAIQVFDIAGREQFRTGQVATGRLQISTGSWPAGVYLMQVQKGEDRILRKLILTH